MRPVGFNLITKMALFFSVDTPDPYVQLEVLDNPCGIKKTGTKINDVNPVWNETFTFVLDPKRENILSTCPFIFQIRNKAIIM